MILNQLKENNTLIIVGSNTFLDDKINQTINNKEVELTTFFGDEFKREEYFSFIFTPSLFYDFKIAIIKNAEKIKDIDEIIKESTRESNNKKIIYFPLQSEKILSNIKNIKNITICKEIKKSYNDYINTIIELFKGTNINIDYNTARELYEMLGRDLLLIKKEVEKISIYFYNKKHPTQKEIFEVINTSQYNSTFKFIEALCNKDKTQALNIYRQLINSNTNMNMLFYLLVKQFRDILLYKISPELVRGQQFLIKKISKASLLWSLEELKKIFENLMNCDYSIKRTSVQLEHLVFNLINLL